MLLQLKDPFPITIPDSLLQATVRWPCQSNPPVRLDLGLSTTAIERPRCEVHGGPQLPGLSGSQRPTSRGVGELANHEEVEQGNRTVALAPSILLVVASSAFESSLAFHRPHRYSQ
jgi:hypothetical protein